MGLINLRELIAFPANGNNASETIINGIPFNKTALQYWNYTLYSNNTLSNTSDCYLIFGQYQPAMFSNGTFVNATSCYVPILPLELRGRLGAVFGSLFGISIMFTLVNLKKHGQLYLREDKRFRIVGRRWQWYWMAMVGAFGMISCITGIDVDRDYLQDLGLILQSLFFLCMGSASVASLWEGLRHWSSWQERQIVDRDPFSLPQDDRRGRIEFYMPLVFYFFGFMSFFMTVPRSWNNVSQQGGSEQQMSVAKPAATDGRFKAGAIFLAVAWLVMIYYVRHALYYYKPHSRGLGSITAVIRHLPIRFPLSLLALAVYIGYGIAMSWIFDISIMKYDVAVFWPFAFGYAPCLIFIIIFNIWGYSEQNEDKQLIQQRIDRGRAADATLGITNKPSWWSKSRGDHHLDDLRRLRNLVNEEQPQNSEKGAITGIREENFELQQVHTTASNPFDDANQARSRSVSRNREITAGAEVQDGLLSTNRSRQPWIVRTPSNNSMSSAMTGQTLATTDGSVQQRQPQVIRSMLDV